jgi:hypothetical protein
MWGGGKYFGRAAEFSHGLGRKFRKHQSTVKAKLEIKSVLDLGCARTTEPIQAHSSGFPQLPAVINRRHLKRKGIAPVANRNFPLSWKFAMILLIFSNHARRFLCQGDRLEAVEGPFYH